MVGTATLWLSVSPAGEAIVIFEQEGDIYGL